VPELGHGTNTQEADNDLVHHQHHLYQYDDSSRADHDDDHPSRRRQL